MAERNDFVKVAAAAAVGALVATVLALAFTGRLSGDKSTDVTLWQVGNGPCEMGKQTYVTVKQEKNLTWKIRSHCKTQAVVAVGNFRPQKDGGNSDCSAAGSASPFPGQQPASVTLPPAEDDDGSKGQIKLKAKKLDNGEQPETYYFDICLNSVSVDPTLMIER